MIKFGLLLFLCCVSALSQPQWQPLTGIPTNVGYTRFDDVFFITDDIGWAADGGNATVYKTTDGGINWAVQLSEEDFNTSSYYFRNVEFLDENIGFVGTLNGIFFKTVDGGETWTQVTNISPNPVAICGLDAVGPSTIYGCGAYFSPAFIIKSVDSGETWEYIDMSAYANALVEILFVDEMTGYASGRKPSEGGVILKTTDGGVTWTELYTSGINGEYVWKMQRLQSNPDVMFASVESVAPLTGKLLKSTDGGVSWESTPVPDTGIQSVGFLTENHGWMGGHHSGFLETFDAGTTWTDIGIGSNLNRIFIINDNLAYASGTTIYKFTDQDLATEGFSEQGRIPLNASVHPNPVADKLNITIEFPSADHLVLELYDNAGHLIKEMLKEDIDGASKKAYTFDFPYESGVYLINLHTNTGRQSVKFIK